MQVEKIARWTDGQSQANQGRQWFWLRTRLASQTQYERSVHWNRQESLDTLAESRNIRNGNQHRILMFNQWIGMTSRDPCPVNFILYRIELRSQEFEQKEIDKVLRMYVIEPALLEYALPILFDSKKNSFLPICTDYRKYKAVNIKKRYRIPQLNECRDFFGEVGIF